MKEQLKLANNLTAHSKAFGVLGHVVKPGYISFYSMNGKTYAVAEGRWWLMKKPIKAGWVKHAKNVSLTENNLNVGLARIIRVLPGEVGFIREQGTEVLLDVGTHVFNSGIVSIHDKVEYNKVRHFNHGRFHYLRVDRGYFAKVWAVVMIDGMETVVPRVRARHVQFISSYQATTFPHLYYVATCSLIPYLHSF